jgi:(p)ppGpp synthase/HD superfamily hydrolase
LYSALAAKGVSVWFDDAVLELGVSMPGLPRPVVAAPLNPGAEFRVAEVIAAAILHDTVEDTQTSPAELAARFGPKISAIVTEVTDDKSLPKAERKRLQIEQAAAASPEAQLVKLADKICNLRDLDTMPPANWSLERQRE